MTITYSLLQELSFIENTIALNAYQLRLLGIGWPPKHGWTRHLIGTDIPEDTIRLIAELRGPRSKQARNTILARHNMTAADLFHHPLTKL